MSKEINLEQETKAVNTIQKWAGAGKDAYETVQKIESAKLQGEIVDVSKKDTEKLISGAIKLYLDGNMSQKSRKLLESKGLDPENLRKSIIEATMPQTIDKIVIDGDIERLVALGQLTGEKAPNDLPAGAKRITRERITIEVE